MADATLRHGNPVTIDYTAGADITSGDIILLGNTTGLANGIAPRDIANTDLGALDVGGGVYDVKVADNYALGSKVYWDSANSVLTTTSTNMSQFGYTVEAAAAANAIVKVLHDPKV